MPFSSAMPKSAINPTEDGTDKFRPDNQRATMPPTRAKGMLIIISNELFKDPKFIKSKIKTIANVIGITIKSRLLACC